VARLPCGWWRHACCSAAVTCTLLPSSDLLLPCPATTPPRPPPQANTDAGNAAAGFLNIQRSYGSKIAQRNFPGAAAATAVGNAVAGGVTIAIAESGKAQIGDYDDENDTPENDVAATTRGRGTAEAGLVSIAVGPNDSAEVLGDVKATANQGSAVAGAFSETNSYETSEQGVDVNARTSEYEAGA
jgi:hypothetical protein